MSDSVNRNQPAHPVERSAGMVPVRDDDAVADGDVLYAERTGVASPPVGIELLRNKQDRAREAGVIFQRLLGDPVPSPSGHRPDVDPEAAPRQPPGWPDERIHTGTLVPRRGPDPRAEDVEEKQPVQVVGDGRLRTVGTGPAWGGPARTQRRSQTPPWMLDARTELARQAAPLVGQFVNEVDQRLWSVQEILQTHPNFYPAIGANPRILPADREEFLNRSQDIASHACGIGHSAGDSKLCEFLTQQASKGPATDASDAIQGFADAFRNFLFASETLNAALPWSHFPVDQASSCPRGEAGLRRLLSCLAPEPNLPAISYAAITVGRKAEALVNAAQAVPDQITARIERGVNP